MKSRIMHLSAFLALAMMAVSAFCATLQIEHFKIGEDEITCIQDSPMNYRSVQLENSLEDAKRLKCYPKDQVRASINIFLIKHKGKYILVDTGIGGRNSSLVAALDDMHIHPSQINAIVLTHLHGDHLGGLFSAIKQRVFQNATVWLSMDEYTSTFKKDCKNIEIFKQLQTAYRRNMKYFKDNDEIVPGLKARLCPGHTAGHAIFILDDKVCFIGSTVMALQWQLGEPDLYVHDAEEQPALAIQSRKKLLEEYADKDMILAGGHLPFPGLGRIVKGEKSGYVFKPYKGK